MASSDTQLEVWCAGEEWCPVTSTSTVLSGKWNPVVVHRLLNHGGCGFNELKEAVDGVSSKVLSDTLETLEGYGIVDREIVSEKPFRVRYSLTERGHSLEPVIREMEAWGTEHLTEGARDSRP
jgi:DNA-binding HxlR family transcriptional regulator